MTRPYTPEELLERIIPHLDQRKLRRRVTKDGKQVQARCPFHDDDEPRPEPNPSERRTAGVLL
jgi:hypothetical protein